MTKKTREASSKGLGRRKVKKGKEGQKEEKAAIVTTGSWEKNHTKSSYLFSHREEESGKTIGGGDQGTKLESPTYV